MSKKPIRKIYLIGNYDKLPQIYNTQVTKDPAEADIIVWFGGNDINPRIYLEKPHMSTQNPINERDLLELGYFFQYPNAFKLGICRGAQLLTATNGGKLIQNVSNHTRDHDIIFNGKKVRITSAHHQMMYPFNLQPEEYKILGYNERISKYYNYNDLQDVEIPIEPEVVWYPKTRSLCVQGHPEWMKENDDFISELNETINRLF